jgi:hypothetical protein
MNDRQADRRIAVWLEDGPIEPSPAAVDEAIVATAHVSQRRHARTFVWRDRMSTTARLLVATLAVVAVVAFGASRLLPASSGPGGPGPGASPTVGRLTGAYTGTVGTNSVGAMTGDWDLIFSAAQLFYQNPGGASFTQPLRFTGPDEFTVAADDCPTGTGEGRYRWSQAADGTLTLTVVADPSQCRVTVLTAGPWQHVSGT